MLWACLDRLRYSIVRLRVESHLDSDIAETFSKGERRTDKLGVQRAADFFFSVKLHRVSAEYPIGIKPVDHVIVAGYSYELLFGTANSLADGEGADKCKAL